MRVAVTGASGFIGSHVVAQCVTAGHTPVVLIRNEEKWANAVRLHELPDIETVVGDVASDESIRGLLTGCDAVVHTAGMVSLSGGDEERVRSINTTAAALVMSIAAELRLDPIVHTSSIGALYPAPGTIMTSDDPPGTSSSVYGQTKAGAEIAARQLQSDGHPVVIVYPGGVIGPLDPGSGDLLDANIELIEKGLFMVPKGAKGGFVDVRDLAEGMVNSLTPGEGPRRLMVGGRFIAYQEWMKAIEISADRKVRTLHVPPRVLIGIAAGLDRVSKLAKKELPLTREGAEMMSYAKPTDDAAFLELLGRGYRPLQESIDDMVEFMVADGRVTLPEAKADGPSRSDSVTTKVVTSSAFRKVGPRVIPPMHRAMAKLSAGKFVPGAAVVLTTTGAKSGLPRATPLEAIPDGDDLLIVGSNFAQDHHPAWTHNLIANPEVEVLYKGTTSSMTGTLLEGADREDAWQKALAHWPSWSEYGANTNREFRIFRLTPR